ncbi:MAG: M48 family metalloprotease [Gammaproteobacteria bacterium]|nr:M48 family metalloprotease [Gammaproteobacteria bacterium]MXW06640.1 M48 family metalloprotease [Gammaproteobacteria bacterium]MYC25182.1 M48 family metalloprotease [Gammaproteobacteria bacterium]
MNTPLSFAFKVATGLFVTLVLSSNVSAEDTLLPDLGDRESAALSPYEEANLGRAFLMHVHRNIPTVDDPILKYFVRNNLFELAEHSDLKVSNLTPIVVDSNELNAFAAPGGVIGINLGLLIFADDIHQYSSVVAHELAHLSQRHFARRVDQARQLGVSHLLGFLTSAAIFAAGGTDPGLAAMAVSNSLNQNLGFKYSRIQEHEADRIGLNALTDAGFDPMGAVRMFERMKERFRYASSSESYFLRTHPLTDERISDLRNHAQTTEETEFEQSLEYQLMRVRVTHRYFDTGGAAMAHAESLDGDALHEKYDLALALVRNNEQTRAVELMEEVYDADPNSIVVIACFADLLIKANQGERALKLVDAALANTPNNEPLSLLKARALRSLERYEDATSIVKRIVRQSSNDPDLWLELEVIAGLAKNIFEVHRARAERYALRGQFPAAIENLQLAKKLIEDKSSILEASLNQRIQELRKAAALNS